MHQIQCQMLSTQIYVVSNSLYSSTRGITFSEHSFFLVQVKKFNLVLLFPFPLQCYR